METAARNRIKDFHFETNKTSLYHLHSIKEITSDEHKTLTKISMRNLSQQFPQTSAHIGHDKIRNKQTGEKHRAIAKNGGKLTPQHMYEAVKRYKTYVAHNKRLEGKGTSSSTSQPKATGHTSGYKLWFHKTTAFAATIAESEDDDPCHHESSSQEGADPFGAESSQEDDEGLFIPSYLEEALPNDPVLQVKMVHAMQAQEVETRRCFTCNQQGHLQRDHWKYEEKNGTRPLQPKGSPLNKSA